MKFYGLSVFLVFNVFITSLNAIYFHYIPVQISSYNNLPYVAVNIENEEYFLLVDLGSKLTLSLAKNILEKNAGRIPYGTAKWIDNFGNSYEMPAHILSEVKIANIVINNIVANEEYNAGQTPRDGVIGRSLLSRFNLLLDFSNSSILTTDDFCCLGVLGYDLDKFIKVPFSGARNEIIFSIKIDNVDKRFLLSTGCSISFINASFFKDQKFELEQFGLPIYSTSKFSIGDYDFGLTDLHVMDFFTMDIIDAVLGMDFLKKHVVYVDFENKYLYIQPNVNDSPICRNE